jgi:hypothetical protein
MGRSLNILVITLVCWPFLRIIEGICRTVFMSDYYGSFWAACLNDWFFSEGWVLYIQTPLGATMAALNFVVVVIALVCCARLYFYSGDEETE